MTDCPPEWVSWCCRLQTTWRTYFGVLPNGTDQGKPQCTDIFAHLPPIPEWRCPGGCPDQSYQGVGVAEDAGHWNGDEYEGWLTHSFVVGGWVILPFPLPHWSEDWSGRGAWEWVRGAPFCQAASMPGHAAPCYTACLEDPGCLFGFMRPVGWCRCRLHDRRVKQPYY